MGKVIGKTTFCAYALQVALLVTMLLVTGCPPRHPPPAAVSATAPLRVVATFFPVADLVRQVGGEHVRVQTLLPPEGELHTFAPTVKQMKMLQEAQVVFALGLGAEPFLDALLRALGDKQTRVVEVAEGCFTLPADASDHHGHAHAHHHDHHHHEHEHDHAHAHEHEAEEEAVDPHVWLSLQNAMQMVQNIAHALAELDPSHREEYHRNANLLLAELRQLKGELQAASRGWTRRQFIATHGAYRYLAEEAGLEQVAVFEPLPGVEPSARWLRQLIDRAREGGVQVIFAAPPASSRLVEVVAADLGVPVFLLDPLERTLAPQGASYQQRMRRNIETLNRAMR